MITAQDIGNTITLTKDTEELTGVLRSIALSPEVLETIPGVVQGNYKDVWSPGYKNITMTVEVTTQNENSSILTEIEGVVFYDIEGELFTIESIEQESDSDKRTAFISLIHKQGSSENLELGVILNFTVGGVPKVFTQNNGDFAPNTNYELNLVTPAVLNPSSLSEAFFNVTFSVYPFGGVDNFLATRMSRDVTSFTLTKTVMARGGVLVKEIWSTNGYTTGYKHSIVGFRRVADDKDTTKFNQYTFGLFGVQRTSVLV